MELFKGDAVRFFGVDKRIVSVARTELSEIKLQKNIDDWVLEADDDSFVHLEFQGVYKKEDLKRFMVSDAMLYHKEGKPVRTIVVYSADITQTETVLEAGSIRYEVEAFYMAKLDGDKAYDELKGKVKAGTPLSKQDLMSIVFLPLMKNSVDKETRIEQSAELSRKIENTDEQLQIQAMLRLLAEKFIKDNKKLSKLKGVLNMGVLTQMIREDHSVEIAKDMLRDGKPVAEIIRYLRLDELTVERLQAELSS
jgi:hypothetical protein